MQELLVWMTMVLDETVVLYSGHCQKSNGYSLARFDRHPITRSSCHLVIAMWPLVRQARYLGRYRQIAQVLGSHGFGYLVEQLGLAPLLSLPRRIVRRPVPDPLGGPERLRRALVALGPT